MGKTGNLMGEICTIKFEVVEFAARTPAFFDHIEIAFDRQYINTKRLITRLSQIQDLLRP